MMFFLKNKIMIKLLRFIVVVGLLGVISSCDYARYCPMNIDKLNTNIVAFPIDTDSARVEITYNGFSKMCYVYLHLPEGCEVNEDSLGVWFSGLDYSCGKVEKCVIDKRDRPLTQKVSKIDPSHELSFFLYNSGEPGAFSNVPNRMYLKMSGVIVKDGKSLMNDTITVVGLYEGLLRAK